MFSIYLKYVCYLHNVCLRNHRSHWVSAAVFMFGDQFSCKLKCLVVQKNAITKLWALIPNFKLITNTWRTKTPPAKNECME